MENLDPDVSVQEVVKNHEEDQNLVRRNEIRREIRTEIRTEIVNARGIEIAKEIVKENGEKNWRYIKHKLMPLRTTNCFRFFRSPNVLMMSVNAEGVNAIVSEIVTGNVNGNTKSNILIRF